MRFRFSFLSLIVAPFIWSCAPLQTLPSDSCGNGVVEPELGEDCEPVLASVFYCRPPGDPLQCTIRCIAGETCPTGYGCGADAVCRKPSGSFEADAFVQAGSQAEQLMSGDFDGDGRDDVVAVEPGRARIYFADDSGNVEQFTVASALPPAIGTLGPQVKAGATPADTTDDLVLPLKLGIGTLLAETDRSFTSKTYGSIPLKLVPLEFSGDGTGVVWCSVLGVLPFTADALASSALGATSGDETLVLLHVNCLSGGEQVVLAGVAVTGIDVLFPLSETNLDNIVGVPVAGNFDTDTCDELVIPREGATSLSIYKLCKFSNSIESSWATEKTESEARIAEVGIVGTIAGPAFVRDINGDSHDDLAITVLGQAGLELQVAYGYGKATFHSKPSLASGETPDFAAAPYGLLDNGAPLALGFINDDELLDLVDSGGIAKGYPPDAISPLVDFRPWRKADRLWTDAVITDINDDGHPDVLASSDGTTDVDVLLATDSEEELWNPSQIATDGTVSQLVSGDFDGDLVQDIVFDNVLSSEDTRILISYGRTYGGPEEAAEVGAVDSVERLMTGNIHVFGEDNVSDLGLISSSAGERSISFFPGTASRLLQAPLLLIDDQGRNEPLAAASGMLQYNSGFNQKGARRDVVVLATKDNSKLNAGKSLPPATVLKELASSLRVFGLYGGDEDAELIRSMAATCAIPGAIQFPQLEEASSITISAAPPSDGGFVFVTTPVVNADEVIAVTDMQISSVVGSLFFSDIPECWPPEPGLGVYYQSAPGELFSRVRTADLNKDGTPEVLVLKKTYDPYDLRNAYATSVAEALTAGLPPDGAPPEPFNTLTPLKSELVIFWGGNMFYPYTLPGSLSDVRDFATWDINGNGVPDLLVLDGAQLYQFEVWYPRAEELNDPLLLPVSLPPEGAQAISLADVNGDGIADLALRSGAALRVYKGLSDRNIAVTAGPGVAEQ